MEHNFLKELTICLSEDVKYEVLNKGFTFKDQDLNEKLLKEIDALNKLSSAVNFRAVNKLFNGAGINIGSVTQLFNDFLKNNKEFNLTLKDFTMVDRGCQDGGSDFFLSLELNKEFPLISTVIIEFAHKRALSIVSQDCCELKKYLEMKKNLDSEIKKMEDCKDKVFLETYLEPYKAEVKKAKRKCVELKVFDTLGVISDQKLAIYKNMGLESSLGEELIEATHVTKKLKA